MLHRRSARAVCDSFGLQQQAIAQSATSGVGWYRSSLKTSAPDLSASSNNPKSSRIRGCRSRPIFRLSVSVERQGDVLLVDVAITGGFTHHGLLVATTALPSGFSPRRSN